MLEWYRELIALRKRLVTPGPRTCWAQLASFGTLEMQVPAENPTLMVIAGFPDSPCMAPRERWRPVMESNEDGYRVLILQRG